MTIDVKPRDVATIAPVKSLKKVLEQSEKVKDLVEEAGEELSSANTVLKQELAEQGVPPMVEKAIEKSGIAEEKVQEAAEGLAVINVALESEIKARHVLEFQYAAATEQKDSARHESLHDSLTGLPNRGLFNDRLEHGLLQAQRHGRNLAVMFIDLDDFKLINDSHGHAVGDSVLQVIAARLMENTRSDDTISRHGGDEFLYLLMETKEKSDIALIAEKLIAAIEVPFDVRTGEFDISHKIRASIGISMYPKDGESADILIGSADKAMYRAKKEKTGFSFAA